MDSTRPGNEEAVGQASAPRSLDIEQVYAANHDFVWRSVQRLGIPDALVDDATQEVFLAASRHLAEFEGRASVRTWLFAIAIRVVQRLRRTDGRHRRRVAAYGDENKSATVDPYRRSEAAQLLHRLLDALDDAKRVVFVMSELEGMTAPEIAEILDVKVPTIYTRLRAAKQQLQAALARHQEEGAR